MNVTVEVELSAPVQESHLVEMRWAAERLTDDGESVRTYVVPEKPQFMRAEFTMPQARQMDVVEMISHRFAESMQNYKTQSVWFPHPPRRKRKKRVMCSGADGGAARPEPLPAGRKSPKGEA